MIRPDIHHPTGNQSMWRPRLPPLLAAVLIAIFVITAALSVRNTSATWDEPFHLAAGVAYLQTGDPRLNWDHPPLARLIASLPVWLTPIDPIAKQSPTAWKSADVLNAPNGSLDTFEERLLWSSRLTILSLAILLGSLIYAWGSELFGPKAALLPVALYAFCPPLLANAPLVATDLTITTLMFAAVYAWWRYLQAASRGWLLWTCLFVSLSFTAKFTAIALVPIFFLLGALSFLGSAGTQQPDFRHRLWIVGGAWLAIGLAVWFGINLIYLLDGSFLTPPEYIDRVKDLHPHLKGGAEKLNQIWPSWLPVPLPLFYTLGFFSRLTHLEGGHLTYFLGEVSNGGWPNYFLIMLLIKLPLASLFLIGIGMLFGIRRLPSGTLGLAFLLLPIILLLWIASSGKLQIGIRHILPTLPFLLLLSGYFLQGQASYRRHILIGLLIASAAFSSFSVYPYYLMYFNFLAGGPDQGWRISLEGDDWGQGGADLRQWLENHNVKHLAYGPFGWSAGPLRRAGISTSAVPCEDNGELVAIHLGTLLKAFTPEQVRCYTWMRLRKPDEKIGYSIFLYNTKNIPRPPPPSDLHLFNQALALQLKGEKAQSIQVYRQYLLREPDYYQARFNLACALMDTGQCEAAIPEFERTLMLWPGYKEVHLHLANCYRKLGRQDEGRQHEEQYRRN